MFTKNHIYYPPKDRSKWLKSVQTRGSMRKGIPLTKEHIRKLSLARMDKPRKGFKMSQGYRYLFLPKHPYRRHGKYYAEHRYSLENHLSKTNPDSPLLIDEGGYKCLRKEYIVHHIDRNKLNNNPENLMAMTRDKHHAQIVTCPFCKKDFNY